MIALTVTQMVSAVVGWWAGALLYAHLTGKDYGRAMKAGWEVAWFAVVLALIGGAW